MLVEKEKALKNARITEQQWHEMVEKAASYIEQVKKDVFLIKLLRSVGIPERNKSLISFFLDDLTGAASVSFEGHEDDPKGCLVKYNPFSIKRCKKEIEKVFKVNPCTSSTDLCLMLSHQGFTDDVISISQELVAKQKICNRQSIVKARKCSTGIQECKKSLALLLRKRPDIEKKQIYEKLLGMDFTAETIGLALELVKLEKLKPINIEHRSQPQFNKTSIATMA